MNFFLSSILFIQVIDSAFSATNVLLGSPGYVYTNYYSDNTCTGYSFGFDGAYFGQCIPVKFMGMSAYVKLLINDVSKCDYANAGVFMDSSCQILMNTYPDKLPFSVLGVQGSAGNCTIDGGIAPAYRLGAGKLMCSAESPDHVPYPVAVELFSVQKTAGVTDCVNDLPMSFTVIAAGQCIPVQAGPGTTVYVKAEMSSNGASGEFNQYTYSNCTNKAGQLGLPVPINQCESVGVNLLNITTVPFSHIHYIQLNAFPTKAPTAMPVTTTTQMPVTTQTITETGKMTHHEKKMAKKSQSTKKNEGSTSWAAKHNKHSSTNNMGSVKPNAATLEKFWKLLSAPHGKVEMKKNQYGTGLWVSK